jgi:hypothetical protein
MFKAITLQNFTSFLRTQGNLQQAAGYKYPVLIMVGKEDKFTPPESARMMDEKYRADQICRGMNEMTDNQSNNLEIIFNDVRNAKCNYQ